MCGRDAVPATVARHAARRRRGDHRRHDGLLRRRSTAPARTARPRRSRSGSGPRSCSSPTRGGRPQRRRRRPRLRALRSRPRRRRRDREQRGQRHPRPLGPRRDRGALSRGRPRRARRATRASSLPERHLGLVTAAEGPLTPSAATRSRTRSSARSISIGCSRSRGTRARARQRAIGRVLGETARLASRTRATPPVCTPAVRIGVARDLAFQFYYEENLALLRAAGAELVFWSPETDAEIPDVDGLYFGGGYPELRAQRSSANLACAAAVAQVRRGRRARVRGVRRADVPRRGARRRRRAHVTRWSACCRRRCACGRAG